MEGSVICMNPQCIECTQVFMKDTELKNENPSFAKIYGITREEMRDRIFLKKILNSIGNCGSGVLICGVCPNNREKVVGFKPDLQLRDAFFKTADE